MKRELKFRAWDGNEMHHDVCINHLQKAIKQGYRASDWVKDAKAGIPMQFTGLRDKDRKEVYEGDIIEDLITGLIYEVRFGFISRLQYTGWFAYSSIRTTALNNDYGDVDGNNSQILVIGNIYETPELLPKDINS